MEAAPLGQSRPSVSPSGNGAIARCRSTPGTTLTRSSAARRHSGNGWQERARQDPPECIKLASVVPHALNTGIIGDGFRIFDFDRRHGGGRNRARAGGGEVGADDCP